ncbi:MAG: hypothetical protein HY606_09185 [Planctomycetes bacterium]|nr:hypothetical protein [Planctomycetota bacterium]
MTSVITGFLLFWWHNTFYHPMNTVKKIVPVIVFAIAIAILLLIKNLSAPHGNGKRGRENTLSKPDGTRIFPDMSSHRTTLDKEEDAFVTDSKGNKIAVSKLRKYFRVKGRVIDIFGAGVPDCNVSWSVKTEEGVNRSTSRMSQIVTDKEGYFYVEQMYAEDVSHSGTLKLFVSESNKGYFSKIQEVLLSGELEEHNNIEIRLLDTASLTFDVTSANGKIQNAVVYAITDDNINSFAFTDATGFAKMKVPANLKLKVSCMATGYKPWGKEFTSAGSSEDYFQVFLEMGSLKLVGRCFTEEGVPINEVEVKVWPVQEHAPFYYMREGFFNAKTDSNGVFIVSNLYTDKVSLSFEHSDYIHPVISNVNVGEEVVARMKKLSRITVAVYLSEKFKQMRYGRQFIFEWKSDSVEYAVPCVWRQDKAEKVFSSVITTYRGVNTFVCKIFNEDTGKWESYYEYPVNAFDKRQNVTIQLK